LKYLFTLDLTDHSHNGSILYLSVQQCHASFGYSWHSGQWHVIIFVIWQIQSCSGHTARFFAYRLNTGDSNCSVRCTPPIANYTLINDSWCNYLIWWSAIHRLTLEILIHANLTDNNDKQLKLHLLDKTTRRNI